MESNALTEEPYNIGYVLSGDFIKGFAYLGVIRALLEHGIKPDIISGVSVGTLAGVLHADGNEPYRVLSYFPGHKLQDLTKPVIPKVSLFALGESIDFLKLNPKVQKPEGLKLPLITTATDLDHGRSMYFHKRSIAERVVASCHIPALFTPVKIRDICYVDGGLSMDLPVSTIRDECGKVTAVDVSPLVVEKYKMDIVGIAVRSYHFMFRASTFPECDNCDLLIESYNLKGYSNTKPEKAGEIFEQDYDTVSEVLDQLIKEKGGIWR